MTNIKVKSIEYKLTIVNFTIVFYFLLLYLLYFYQIDYVIIGVLRELSTIPFFIAQIIFLIIGIKFMYKEKTYSTLFVVSFILLLIGSLLTFGSFFIS